MEPKLSNLADVEVSILHRVVKLCSPCMEGAEFLASRTPKQAFEECTRVDWFMWLFTSTQPPSDGNVRRHTLAKAMIADKTRRLIKNEKVEKLLDAAIAYGEGKAELEDINTLYEDLCLMDYHDRPAQERCVIDAVDDNCIDNSLQAYYADANETDISRQRYMKDCMEICRKHLPLEIWKF